MLSKTYTFVSVLKGYQYSDGVFTLQLEAEQYQFYATAITEGATKITPLSVGHICVIVGSTYPKTGEMNRVAESIEII